MTNNLSSYALTKSVEQFPQYRAPRGPSETAMKPTYPIQHRSRRSAAA